MQFLINELSVITQAQDHYQADQLMKILVNIIKAIEPIRNLDPLRTHSNFPNLHLAINYPVYKWIWDKLNSSTEKDIGRVLISILKTESIDDILKNSYNSCKCTFNQIDYLDSSLLGAVCLNGNLISLQNAPDFADEEILVQCTTDGYIYEDKHIKNLTNINQIKSIRWLYVPSPKHAIGGWGTLMDLSDEEAQKALDKGIEGGKQIYSFYKGKYYEFQPDNVGGFHGYPIDRSEVPPNVIKLIKI